MKSLALYILLLPSLVVRVPVPPSPRPPVPVLSETRVPYYRIWYLRPRTTAGVKVPYYRSLVPRTTSAVASEM